MSFFSATTCGTAALFALFPAKSLAGLACVLTPPSLGTTVTGVGVLEFALRFLELFPSFVSVSVMSLMLGTLSALDSSAIVRSSSEILALLTLLDDEFNFGLSVLLPLLDELLWTVFCDELELDFELELAVFELEDDVLLVDEDLRFADDDDDDDDETDCADEVAMGFFDEFGSGSFSELESE